jgi:hypothetical protein
MFKKNCPKSNRLVGETSPNLVTLLTGFIGILESPCMRVLQPAATQIRHKSEVTIYLY